MSVLEEVLKLQYSLDGSGVEMAVTQSGGVPDEVKSLPTLMALIMAKSRELDLPVLHVMVNIVPPFCVVPKHRDFLKPARLGHFPCLDRWHYPVKTNPQCFWWDEVGGEKHLPVDKWAGPMPYWLLHNVSNLGKEARIHVVVDFDSVTARGDYSDRLSLMKLQR